MTGAKLQLYSIGKENSYLTNNPQISFFKQVYMRYSNFAMQTINLQFENIGNLSFTDTTKIKLKLDKNGDLIHKNFLEINIPAIYSTNDQSTEFHFHWANNIADIIVKNARIIIGGHVIEEYDTEYIYIYNKLSYSVDKQLQLDKLMCKDKLKYNPQRYSSPANSADINNMLPSYEEQTIFIPLPFWFHRNIGASLPIVNLLYHDAILEIELRPLSQLINYHIEIDTSNPPNLLKHTQIKSVENLQKDKVLAIFKNKTWNINPILNAEYIFLDKELRKTFNKNTLQYVVEPITKVIIQNKHGHLDVRDEPTNSMPHHPCKEIFVVPRRNDVKNTNNWLNFTNWDNYLDTSKYLDHQNYFLELARSHVNINTSENIVNKYAEFRDNTTIISINSSAHTIQAADKITDTDITNLLNIWKYRDFKDIPSINANNYSHFTTNIIQNISIDFDETNRVHKKDYLFFNKLQPYMHHNNYLEGICTYSFSIHPDKYQPSGSCNLGNIKNIRFDIDLKEINTELSNTEKYKYDVLIYMKYYNVLEIKSGMADLLFRI
tara:strand:- start:3773 stop:5419 length:1647 start_codon:yes stop_codon:yes gene_type:complete